MDERNFPGRAEGEGVGREVGRSGGAGQSRCELVMQGVFEMPLVNIGWMATARIPEQSHIGEAAMGSHGP